MEVLNDDFKGSGFKFVLKDTSWTVNPTWSRDGDEMAMKKALRKGPYSALNLYFVGQMRSGYLGYCYYPTSSGSPGSQTQIRDGCTMTWKIVPGGPQQGNDMGRVTSHEVGHWGGLLHVFEGGCSGAGDQVDDTTPQASPSRGCPTGQKSCGSADNINNQMDYSNEYVRCSRLLTCDVKLTIVVNAGRRLQRARSRACRASTTSFARAIRTDASNKRNAI